MRRATIVTVRMMIVLLLGAAALDLKLPGTSRDRVRIHLVDRSASVLVPGPVESLLPSNADEIIAHDGGRKAGGDVITWASFGRSPAFESKSIDPSTTDLSAALTAALGRNPTEIILYTDGRGDPGNALFLCRDRKVPVYTFSLGPTSVKDARILRVEAPADAPPGTPVPVGVVVESTYDVKVRVKCSAEAREVDLVANIPARIAFTLPEPGEFRIDLDVQDACDENNHAVGRVFRRTEKRKVLVLSAAAPALPDFDLRVLQRIPDLGDFDAVLLDNVALPLTDQQALAAWVKAGGGLLLGGGLKSYALGEWKGMPLEELSPLKLKPDLRIAAVFGIDSSGSMTQDFPLAAEAVLEARDVFDDDDDLKPMIFSQEARMLEFSELRKVIPTGPTLIIDGIKTAQRHLDPRPAGRKIIILMTDGITEEKPEDIRQAIAGLKDIGLFIITTNQKVPGATENLSIKNWGELRKRLLEVSRGMQDLFRESPGPVAFSIHPTTSGIGAFSPAWINRTTPKAGAQVLATVGQAPAQDPVLVLGRAGDGRVAALTLDVRTAPPRLLRQLLEGLAGDSDRGLTLSIDPPFVRARGSCKDATFETSGTKVVMRQVASDAWEGRLPEGLSGTVLVRKGRARAAATIPCPPEFEKLGVDRPALERIAAETGGRLLTSPLELDTLPRPENPAPTRGRTIFLIAALALVFVEMAVSTFWKV